MPLTEPKTLAFENVVIDFAGRRLWRGGVEQTLEPKAFGVLALLAASPGRVFTREEILDAVWSHRHVTPSVLNRVATLLRHALGEDAQHPRLLHTVHGTGYRFDLPPPVSPPRTDAPTAADSGAAPGIVSDTVPKRRASDHAPPRRRARAWFWFVPAVPLLFAIGWYAWPVTQPAPAPPSAVQSIPTLMVTPLKPIGDTAATRTIADGLSEELIGSLARIDGLRVIAGESTRLAASQSTAPAQWVERLGISHLLEGSLQQAGQSLRIRLRLVDARSSRTLWAKDFDRDATEVLLLQREIASTVATSLTLTLGVAANAVTKSGDAEFLRRYLAAQALLRQRDGGVEQTAEPAENEFRALIRERPDDARSHAGLALALGARAFRRPLLAAALRAESMQEADIAQRLDPSLPEPWFVQGTAACRENQWESCQTKLEKAVQLAPDFYSARYWAAINLAQLGYLDRAVAMAHEDVLRDPINPAKRFTLARLLDTQGRHEEAREQYRHTDVLAMYGRWFNAVWRRDYTEAARVVEQEMGSTEVLDTYAPRLKASYDAFTRALVDPAHWPQAEAEMHRFETDTGLFNFSSVLLPDAPARAAELIGKLDTLRKRSYSTWDLLLWSRDLVYLRRDPAFGDYLRDNGIVAYWSKHGFPPQCRAHNDAAVCD